MIRILFEAYSWTKSWIHGSVGCFDDGRHDGFATLVILAQFFRTQKSSLVKDTVQSHILYNFIPRSRNNEKLTFDWLIAPFKYSRLPKIDTFLVPPLIRKCVNLWEEKFLVKNHYF